MTDQDIDIEALDAETFAALPAKRKVEIQIELLKRGDWKTIENLGIKVVNANELAESGESDVIEIKSEE